MKRFIFLALSLIPALALAQSNYQKGYVVTNSKDTLNGYIDYKEKSNNPSAISFKSSLEGKPETYNLGTAGAFSIVNFESYERFVVNLSQSSDGKSRLSYGPDTSVVRDTVFLRVIQAGKNVSLYAYTDNIKTRYFLLDKDAREPEELLSGIYFVNESGKTQVIDRYKRQLISSMIKYNQYREADQRRLASLPYTSSALLREVSKINGQETTREKASFRFFAGAGLSTNKVSYSGKSQFNTPGTTQKTSYTPMFTTGVDLLANPHIGKLVYRAEFSFMMAKGDITTTNVEPIYAYRNHTFDSYTLAVTPQVLYSFYNSQTLKVYAGVGAGFNFSSNKNNQIATKVIASDLLRIEENRVELEAFYFAPSVNAGIILSKKYELFGNYYFESPISNYTGFNVCLERVNIGFKYHFSKK